MKNIEMKYFNTYYYCNIIMNTINNFDFLTTINQFFEGYFGEEEDANYIQFPRQTIMHEFLQWVIDCIMWEEMREFINRTDEWSGEEENLYNWIFCDDYGRENTTFIENLLILYDNQPIDFRKWWINEVKDQKIIDAHELLAKYIDENEKRYSTTIDKLSDEVFYLLFQNRKFLLWFNETVASYNKVVCERKTVPEWVKRTVRYRDKGRCVFCGREITGKYETQEDYLEHFDHIVPLAQYGINCVTNMQLACKDCNEAKNDATATNDVYITWYDKNEI